MEVSKKPVVSIIMPTFNSAKFVSDSIISIINQTFTNWELLITDDCSTDNTFNLIKEYSNKDNRVKVYRLKRNGGAGIARNNSIKHAKGRYIAFCDSDDRWLPEKLEKQIHFMQCSEIALSYTDYKIENEKNRIEAVFRSPAKITYHDMLKTDNIGCLTAVYDTQMIGKHFMPPIRKRQDWALWLIILKKTPYALGLQESLAIYKKRSSSISSNKVKLIKYIWAIYRFEEKLSFPVSVFRICAYFFHYFHKQIVNIERVV